MNVIYYLILTYPFVQLLIGCIFEGKNLATTSVIYMAVIATMLLKHNKEISIRWLGALLCAIAFPTISLLHTGNAIEFGVEISFVVYFCATVVLLYTYSDGQFLLEQFREFVLNRQHLVIWVNFLYLSLLGIHVMIYGLSAGWTTYVLQGPYFLPHSLAYVLLMILCLNVMLAMATKRIIYTGFSLILLGLIIMTAVRTILFNIIAIALFVLYKLIISRNIKGGIYFLISLVLFISVGIYLDIFDALIEKTAAAIIGSDITSGRGTILIGTLLPFIDEGIPVYQWFIGAGLNEVFYNNITFMGAAIHAHNDFVDVIVSYGLITFFLYMLFMYQFSKKNVLLIFSFVFILAYSNGLFMYVDCLPILIYIRLLFESEFISQRR
jgi:membrane protein